MIGMEDEFKKMAERFGPKGMRELNVLDSLNISLLNRLYLVSAVAANLKQFDEDLADRFYKSQSQNINVLVSDLDKFTDAFQEKHGEI